MKLRIATRGSKLALWQAHYTQDLLKTHGISSELIVLKTKGDKIQHLSFDKIEGKGFFTKEIEDALLDWRADLAVHSMKDLPTTHPDGLVVTAVSQRANPADCLVIRKERCVMDRVMRLPEGATVGTSSARRKAQLLHFRNDLDLKDIRGNVPTRLQKLRDGQFDAIVLAAAGLERLEMNLDEFSTLQFSPKEFVSAPAQGVLAWQTRADDLHIRRALKAIHTPEVSSATNVERTVLKLMEGGCQMPIGVYCERDPMHNYHAYAAYADAWDAPVRRAQLSQSTTMGMAKKLVDLLRG